MLANLIREALALFAMRERQGDPATIKSLAGKWKNWGFEGFGRLKQELTIPQRLRTPMGSSE